jgi:hypothetical protein
MVGGEYGGLKKHTDLSTALFEPRFHWAKRFQNQGFCAILLRRKSLIVISKLGKHGTF